MCIHVMYENINISYALLVTILLEELDRFCVFDCLWSSGNPIKKNLIFLLNIYINNKHFYKPLGSFSLAPLSVIFQFY